MTHFLDILPPPGGWHQHSSGEEIQQEPIEESEWTVEVPVEIEEKPLLDNHDQSIEGTAVAALAVTLLLGAALFAMSKLKLTKVQ